MRVYRSNHTDPAWNLAAEEWLFQSGQDALFLYINEASVILGCHQSLEREVNADYCRAHQIRICRRISGGGAVYHDAGNLNFCFVGPRDASPLSKDFLRPIVQILQGMDLSVEIGSRKDLWIGDRKITGTASHFAKQRSLQHGTLLYDANLEHLHAALGLIIQADASVQLSEHKRALSVRAVHSQPSPVANLRAFLAGNMDANAFFDTFARCSADYFETTIASFDTQEEAAIDRLAQQKYRQKEWIYKR